MPQREQGPKPFVCPLADAGEDAGELDGGTMPLPLFDSGA